MMDNPIVELNEKISSLLKRGAEGLALFVSKNEDASTEDLARDAIRHIDATLVEGEGIDVSELSL